MNGFTQGKIYFTFERFFMDPEFIPVFQGFTRLNQGEMLGLVRIGQ